jgi:hypothetical protein
VGDRAGSTVWGSGSVGVPLSGWNRGLGTCNRLCFVFAFFVCLKGVSVGRFEMRIADSRKAAWRDCADAEGLSLAAWIGWLADSEAQRRWRLERGSLLEHLERKRLLREMRVGS